MLKFISIPLFIVSFLLGIVFAQVKKPKSDIVYIYPTPKNVKKYQWVDKSENCYGWTRDEVHCPDNPNEIQSIPIQN